MDCIFCEIVAGKIPNYTVYEDDNVLAFLDIHPCSKGHTVVVPKKHFTNLAEMNETEWANLMLGIRKSAEIVENKLKPEGLNIAINDRASAGQVVPHVHWHIFPRWQNDGGTSSHSIIKIKETLDVSDIAKLFKK